MILRITRIPVGFGEKEVRAHVNNPKATMKTRKVVGALAIIHIPRGSLKNIIALLDVGFAIEVIQW